MSSPHPKPLRVLFLCTGNSARSPIAETVMNRKSRGKFVAESAGSHPATQVNPNAIAILEEHGFQWTGNQPRGIDGLESGDWDFVITVCDRAKEACPVFPGQPVVAHWGLPDPAAVSGGEEEIHRAFLDAFLVLSRRIDLFLALPFEKLSRLALEHRVRAIGGAGMDWPIPHAV
ncbi:MAG: arsenate reductase ArsC [Gemmatimonadota bacterium]